MRKSIYLSILLFLVLNFSFSQQEKKLDSLLSVWEDVSQSDSLRIKAYYDYIWNGFVYSKPDKALQLIKPLYKFSNERSSNFGKSVSYNLTGVSNWVKGDYIEALKAYKKALAISEKMNDKYKIGISQSNIGNVYLVQSLYEKAIVQYEKGIKILKQTNDLKGLSIPINNLGIIYQELGDYDKALEYALESYEIKKELNNRRGQASSLSNIANVYISKKDYERGIEFAEKSLKISEEIGDVRGTANTLANLGVLSRRKKDFKAALKYHDEALKLYKGIPHQSGIINTYIDFGDTSLEMKDFKSAIKYCLKSYTLSGKTPAMDEEVSINRCLYKAYKGIGNKDKALEFHEKMLVITDSLQKEEAAKKLQQMEFEKQVLADSLLQVEKDLKTEMAHQEEVRKKDMNKNIALAGGVFFLFLSGGLYGRWRYVKKSKAIIEKEKDRSENLLLNILPAEIAEELKAKGSADARDFDMVSILFTDFKGFTQASEKLTAKELISEINDCFKAFDHICESYGIEKIKTIGDAYMAAGGLPIPSEDAAKNTVLAALEMQKFISDRFKAKSLNGDIAFKMRVGVHTGPVVAGIVGVKKFQYDIWGDTVNTASRMESSGEVGQVNISEATYNLIKDESHFQFESRGNIKAKGKGELRMFFVSKP